MKLTVRGYRLALLGLLAMASLAFCARGAFRLSPESTKRYPGEGWQPTKRFCAIYDFSYGGSWMGYIPGGFSSGGNWAYGNTCGNPGNTLCGTPTSAKCEGGCDQARDVPIMFINGQQDFGSYMVSFSENLNSTGSRTAIYWDRNRGHSYVDPELAFMFYVQCLRLRLPEGATSLRNTPREKGWLGDNDIATSWDTDCPYITHYSEYERDKSTAAWFPTRYLAYCWRATVLGKGAAETSPINISRPPTHDRWEWPEYQAGDDIPVEAMYTNTHGADRVDLCNGDNVIASLPVAAYGLYRATWKNAPAGLHGIVAVAYKGATPVATSRLRPVIVNGKAKLDPVDLDDVRVMVPPAAGSVSAWTFPPRQRLLIVDRQAAGRAGGVAFQADGRTINGRLFGSSFRRATSTVIVSVP